MTIAELHSNEELRRHEFPIVAEKAFLAHAGVCPLPRRAVEAVKRCADLAAVANQEVVVPIAQMQRVRELFAQLTGAQTPEIAIVGPTTLAVNFVAAGLRWRKGENILVYFDDYPANVYPWMALAEKGVEVRLLNIRDLGRIRAIDVLGQADEQTRLVALASNHFISGWRIDIEAIGRGLRERGILFSLDAIQTLGAFPTLARHCDFMAADSHKWLLGPCGAGLLYVRAGVQDRLHPISLGQHNIQSPNFIAQEKMVLTKDARRFEAGAPYLLGIAGMSASLEMILEIGVENITAELLRKRAWVVPALQKKGCVVLHADAPPAHASAIITFHKPGDDMAAVHKKLVGAKIETSLRSDRAGRQYVRLSPHFYNTDAELQRVIEQL